MQSDFALATARLRLYAPSLAEIDDLMRDERSALGTRIHAAIPPEWPGPNLTSALPIIADAMRQEPGDARWVWLIIEPTTARVIGDIGFHEPLRAGTTVEIGYVLLPDAHGHGYATEATSALIDWTFARTQVTRIIAQIDPANTASIRVAEKVGMLAQPAVEPGFLCYGIARSTT
jgi:RimJ/RimL family protein N-acetyltransferase